MKTFEEMVEVYLQFDAGKVSEAEFASLLAQTGFTEAELYDEAFYG